MGSRDYFKLGDWNVICDNCGMKRKASECMLTWDNRFVCASTCWEPRHPQDFVRGIPDNQTVPIARPDITQSMGSTTLSSSASKYAKSVVVSSATGISQYSSIGIELDLYVAYTTSVIKRVQWVNVTEVSGTTITISDALWGDAASGNTVYVPGISNETFITATSVTASGL